MSNWRSGIAFAPTSYFFNAGWQHRFDEEKRDYPLWHDTRAELIRRGKWE